MPSFSTTEISVAVTAGFHINWPAASAFNCLSVFISNLSSRKAKKQQRDLAPNGAQLRRLTLDLAIWTVGLLGRICAGRRGYHRRSDFHLGAIVAAAGGSVTFGTVKQSLLGQLHVGILAGPDFQGGLLDRASE
jgi:hypothetical protein